MLAFGFAMFLEAVAALSPDLRPPPIWYSPLVFDTTPLGTAPA